MQRVVWVLGCSCWPLPLRPPCAPDTPAPSVAVLAFPSPVLACARPLSFVPIPSPQPSRSPSLVLAARRRHCRRSAVHSANRYPTPAPTPAPNLAPRPQSRIMRLRCRRRHRPAGGGAGAVAAARTCALPLIGPWFMYVCPVLWYSA